MQMVFSIHQLEDGDRLRLWIDDPVFWDPCLGIFAPFEDEVALRVIRAYDLHDQIGASVAQYTTAAWYPLTSHDHRMFVPLPIANLAPT